jgi:23S rRNA (guanosine2251-2'-O)-methyltransferase
MSETDQVWLEGSIAVEAALQAQSRAVHAIYVRQDKWDGGIGRLQKLADAAGVTVERVSEAFIEARADGRTHGGVIALAGPRRYASLDALLEPEVAPFVVMLDGVEDPFNFGQAVRALYAAGASGLVVRPRNWLSAAGIVARASAGASEWLPLALAETAETAADFYRAHGMVVACATGEKAIPLYEADLTTPLFLLIGGEKRGITRSFLAGTDLRLQIPYQRPFTHSLGTAASAAILAFEVMRQRRLTYAR